MIIRIQVVHHPKETLACHTFTVTSPQPLLPAITAQLCITIILTFQNFYIKWNHAVGSLLKLTFPPQHNAFNIHPHFFCILVAYFLGLLDCFWWHTWTTIAERMVSEYGFSSLKKTLHLYLFDSVWTKILALKLNADTSFFLS